MQVQGADFDPDAVPGDVRDLAIYQIRKADLPNLNGLNRLKLRSLELRWVSTPDFGALPLPETVETLDVWQSPKLKSLDGIEQARRLRRLIWHDNGPLENAAALARLPALKILQIEGGMNQRQKLADLEVLRDLDLDTLVLSGVGPHSLDVAPILAMTSLKRIFVLGSDLDIASLARLAARFPPLHAALHNLEPTHSSLGLRCKSCGRAQVMLRLRGRKFLWCPDCEAAALDRTLARFDAMVEAARQDGIEPLSGIELAKE